MPIDYVIPYVNMDDPEWQKLYKKYVRKDPRKNIERFRDLGTLKYQFRGIEKNMPWVRYIYLVVQSKSQIPKWLNTKHPKLKIVFHKDYIPSRFLPTFNSNIIELWYHKIPGISKTFIAANDDMIPIKFNKEEFYFRNDKPVYSIKLLEKNFKNKSRTVWSRILFNTMRLSSSLAGKKTVYKYTRPHLLVPHSLDIINEIWKKAKIYLYNSMEKSKVRTANNCNHWTYQFYGAITKKAIMDMNIPHTGYFEIKDDSNLDAISNIIKRSFVICGNDCGAKNPAVISGVMDLINKELSNKSSFEV